MPSPRKGETRDKFISRCMGSGESRRTFPDQKQRAAFCFSQWRNKDSKAVKSQVKKFRPAPNGVVRRLRSSATKRAARLDREFHSKED
jgi:hypothetical protein